MLWTLYYIKLNIHIMNYSKFGIIHTHTHTDTHIKIYFAYSALALQPLKKHDVRL